MRSTDKYFCQFGFIHCQFFRGRRQGRQPLNYIYVYIHIHHIHIYIYMYILVYVYVYVFFVFFYDSCSPQNMVSFRRSKNNFWSFGTARNVQPANTAAAGPDWKGKHLPCAASHIKIGVWAQFMSILGTDNPQKSVPLWTENSIIRSSTF